MRLAAVFNGLARLIKGLLFKSDLISVADEFTSLLVLVQKCARAKCPHLNYDQKSDI